MHDQTLTESEIPDLRCLAGMIIPASAKYGVPGADDETIFSDIVNSIGRDRDDRVMVSLGLEPRPPFPEGHVLEQGDWSLLDPVRSRRPFWRQVS